MGARGTNSRNGKAMESAVAADSAEAAEEAGLQYVNDDRPGYTRKAKGKDFEYFDTEGKTIRDEQRFIRRRRCSSRIVFPSVSKYSKSFPFALRV